MKKYLTLLFVFLLWTGPPVRADTNSASEKAPVEVGFIKVPILISPPPNVPPATKPILTPPITPKIPVVPNNPVLPKTGEARIDGQALSVLGLLFMVLGGLLFRFKIVLKKDNKKHYLTSQTKEKIS